jgi:hypothetical protein
VRAASGAPALLSRSIATAIGNVHPAIAIDFIPLKEQLDAALVRERLLAMLAGSFGALALLLAGLGLYGVMSYAVSRRRAEIGIRMALGAGPAGIVRLVLSRVSVVVGCGLLMASASASGPRPSSHHCCTARSRAIRPRSLRLQLCSRSSVGSPDGCPRGARRGPIPRPSFGRADRSHSTAAPNMTCAQAASSGPVSVLVDRR